MAVGMATTSGLPRCPEDCGGPLGGQFPDSVTPNQALIRRLWGCDKATARALYTITCPICDGSRIRGSDGQKCECDRGEKRIHRCPNSHVTPAISVALRHYAHIEGGRFPAPGGLMDQAPSFLHCCSVLTGEIGKIRREEAETQATKSKAQAAASKARGK